MVVADVRWYLDGRSGRDAYRAGHVPGAVWIDLDVVLAGPPSAEAAATRCPVPTPSPGAWPRPASATVPQWSRTTTPVAWPQGRLVWMLRALGESAALLDGGLAAWPGPLAAGDERRVPAAFTPRPLPARRLATADETAAAASTRVAGGVVLDARAPGRYRGETEPIDTRAGHVPGAVNAPFTGNLDPATGRFRSAGGADHAVPVARRRSGR